MGKPSLEWAEGENNGHVKFHWHWEKVLSSYRKKAWHLKGDRTGFESELCPSPALWIFALTCGHCRPHFPHLVFLCVRCGPDQAVISEIPTKCQFHFSTRSVLTFCLTGFRFSTSAMFFPTRWHGRRGDNILLLVLVHHAGSSIDAWQMIPNFKA